jgi:YVTN family beta-propeller protein
MLSSVRIRGVVAAAVSGAVVAAGLVTAQAASGAMPERAQPRAGEPGTVYAVIQTIQVGDRPFGIAIDDVDDTIYVANSGDGTLSTISGVAGVEVLPRLITGTVPSNVAVDLVDDTVYVSNFGDDSLSVFNGRSRVLSRIVRFQAGSDPRGIAVDQADDTIYVALFGANELSVIQGRSLDDSTRLPTTDVGPRGIAADQFDDTVYLGMFGSTSGDGTSVRVFSRTGANTQINVGTGPDGVGLDELDDTVYVANSGTNNVSVINGRTAQEVLPRIGVGAGPGGLAVDQVADLVYVANTGPSATGSTVSVINGRTGVRTDDTITVGAGPYGVAVDSDVTNSGLVYVTNYGSDSVSVIGRVTPTPVAASGVAGTNVTITLTVPNAPNYPMDTSTVQEIFVNGVSAGAGSRGAGNTWQFQAPSGIAAGSPMPITLRLKGAQTNVAAGTFTYSNPIPPVPPTPMTPPGPPRNVTAVAGNGSAVVSWLPPTSSGTYPVTSYLVTARAGSTTRVVSPRNGQTCTRGKGGVGGVGSVQPAEAALSCVVTGLTNGTSYTFTAQAQSQAGSSAPSAPSNPVVPNATSTLTFTSPGNYQCTVNGPVSYQVDGAPGGAGAGQTATA